jgi:tRNA(Ile)-lysidine synthase
VKQEPSLCRTVRKTIATHTLFTPGASVVAAVSGGIDSMVLLDLLASLDDYRLNLVVAHLNHLLRGEESDRDEAFVRDVAVRHGLPVIVHRIDVRQLAREQRLSLEEAGRVARHEFLEQTLGKTGAAVVALGHHADDQAETVLMRLLRGAGSGGLSGMAHRSGWKIRPLLDAGREQIAEYARVREIPYREDSTNVDRRFLRNRVRCDLLPLLTTYNPSISRTLITTAAIQAADDACLSTLADELFGRLAARNGDEINVPVAALGETAQALRMRLYRHAIQDLTGSLASVSFRHLTAIDRLIGRGGPSRSIAIPGAVRVGRNYGTLRFFRDTSEATHEGTRVDGFGRYPVPGGHVLVAPVELPFSIESLTSRHALIDLDTAPFPWTVGTFQDGDRLVPSGMNGSRKLKKLFSDGKVPRHLRRRVPLLRDSAGHILSVMGVRRSNLAPVTVEPRNAALAELLPPLPPESRLEDQVRASQFPRNTCASCGDNDEVADGQTP